jgi:hypothetical protein
MKFALFYQIEGSGGDFHIIAYIPDDFEGKIGDWGPMVFNGLQVPGVHIWLGRDVSGERQECKEFFISALQYPVVLQEDNITYKIKKS